MPFQKVIAWGFPEAIQTLNVHQALINVNAIVELFLKNLFQDLCSTGKN